MILLGEINRYFHWRTEVKVQNGAMKYEQLLNGLESRGSMTFR